MSIFPPISIKRIRDPKENSHSPHHLKWKIKPIFDVFFSNFYNFLHKTSQNFYWFCWPGLTLQTNEQKDLSKFLQENYQIIPIFFDSIKMQTFLENLCYKRFKPACENLFDVFSSEFEQDDVDFEDYNEINKTFAKTALKFISNNLKNFEKNLEKSPKEKNFEKNFEKTFEKNFLILNYHLLRVPFYLRKTILKSNKISKPFYHNISFFFGNGFPNPENIKFLGNFRKLLVSLLFSDLLIFSVFDHARNFFLNCEKYLQLSYKTHEGGRLYYEFEGRILFINIMHHYIEYPIRALHPGFHTSKNSSNIKILREKYQDFCIIVSLDKSENSSMIEMKFEAFRSFCEKQQTPKKFVLFQLIYDVFESAFVKNIEYIEKLTQTANKINKTLKEHHIELIFCNKFSRETLTNLMKNTVIFLKISLIRDESYLHHLEYLCIKDDAIVILSANLFQNKAFKSIITINSLNLNSIQQALHKAIPLINSKLQQCLVMLDRKFLRENNVEHWFLYNNESLKSFAYYKDKEFKFINEGESFHLMLPNSNFEEIEIRNIANTYKNAENRVIVLDFEGAFLDLNKINELLNTNNILEIESKINKCKPLCIINDETLSKFKNIVQDPRNSVYVISSLSHEKLAFFFPEMKDLTLFSENGYFCQKIGRDEEPFVNFYEKADTSWKAIVQTVILEYVAKTEGSYLIEKKYSLIWIFDKVDKDFANIQAKELMEHLTEVLEFIDVIEIAKYETLIEVRLKNCHKVGFGGKWVVFFIRFCHF